MLTNRGKLYPPVDFQHAKQYGLDDIEWERIVDRLGRNPNDMECAIFAMLWSENYCNKSSASLLDTIQEQRNHPKSIRLAGSRVGLVDIGNGEYVALRAVANNSQSYIDAHFGVETCMDMALNELTTVGATPLAILNVLRFGSHDIIANQRLFQAAVSGVSAYGNRFGTPVIGGELYFHPQYNYSTIVNSCALGILKNNKVLKREKPANGSLVVYLGAKTGRDGLLENNKSKEDSLLDRQRERRTLKLSDPLLSARLISATAEAISNGYLQDVVSAGIGGLGTATFDLAARIANPLRLEIDKIPLRIEGLTPKEILLSESSERLLIVVTKEAHRRLVDIFHKWDIDSVVVGQVIDSDGIEFYWNHYNAADIPFQFAMGGSIQKHFEVVKFPPMLRRADSAEAAEAIRKRKRKVDDGWGVVREVAEGKKSLTGEIDRSTNLEDSWLDMLANPNLCSRRPMYRNFDQAVGGNALIRAGGDGAVIRLKSNGATPTSDNNTGPQRGLAVSVDSNSLYVGMEPYLGTVQSVAESMRNLAAVGARPIALAYSLNFGDPGRYREVCDLSEAIRGLGDAAKIWDIPIVSEFVSLFNGSEGNPTLPTPAVMLVGLVEDVTKCVSVNFKNKGDKILLLGKTDNEIGCSEYGWYTHHQINRLVPDINFDIEKQNCEFICKLVELSLLQSSHDLSGGGLATAFAESCLSGERPIGAHLKVENTLGEKDYRDDALLFSETSGRFLVSCKAENEETIRRLAAEAGVPVTAYGEVGGREMKFLGAVEVELPLSTAYKLWARRLNLLLGITAKQAAM